MSVTKLLSLDMEQTTIMLYQVAAGSADDLHEHSDYYQISIPLIGNPQMQCNGEVRRMEGSHRLVLSPGYQHRHVAQEDTARFMLIFFEAEFLQNVLYERTERSLVQMEFSPWGVGGTDGFRQLAESAVMQTIQQPMETLELEELQWEMANLLLSFQEGSHSHKRFSPVSYSGHPLVKHLVQFINEESSTDITLDRLTDVSGLSKFHLLRLFRDNTGLTPSQFLTEVRLNHAISLLQHTRLDITRIAFEVGFGSLSSFERTFKKKYGISASQYRKT